MNNIAVLITCHNRKNVTLTCLKRLLLMQNNIDVFCVDDNSNDGTFEAIQIQYPNIRLIKGSGNLFWCRGMRLAWLEASKTYSYDYYIWLNDDMILYDNSFEEIMECSQIYNNQAIISGLVQEESTGDAIYGGFNERQQIIIANGLNNNIYRLNGNFVLIPKYVFDRLGYFDNIYHHDIGDVDYGLMAQSAGIPVVSTRIYIGSTKADLKRKSLRIRRYGVNIISRFKTLYAPLGAPPSIHYYFIRKHKGLIPAVAYYLYLHVINILPDRCWNIIEPLIYRTK